MSDVVLRCPNCGTTQGTRGECEACHEAEVRYFCTNHTPGRWLDGPVCADCAALAAREARRPPPRPPPPRPTPPPAERPRTPPRAAPRTPPRREIPVREPPPREPPVREVPVREVPMRDIPGRARWGGRVWPLPGAARPAPVPVDVAAPPRWPGEAASAARVAVRTAAGCVMRLVGLVVLLIILAFIAIVLFGGPIQEWIQDFAQPEQVGAAGDVPEQTRRGMEAYWSGDLARAERELTEAARAHPQSALALQYLAKMRMDAGDVERANAYLRAAVAREPDNAVAHRELAGSYLVRASRAASGSAAARSDLLSASRHYQRALAIDPTDQRAMGYYACALAEVGEAAQAARLLARAGSGPWESCAR